MSLDKKKRFDIKWLLAGLCIAMRLLVLAFDAVEGYLLQERPFVASYFSLQMVAVLLDGVVVLLLYALLRQLSGRVAPALIASLLYCLWPFMDQFVTAAQPTALGVTLVASLVAVWAANALIAARRPGVVAAFAQLLLQVVALLLVPPAVGLGAVMAALMLFAHSYRLPAQCRHRHWLSALAFLLGFGFAFFRGTFVLPPLTVEVGGVFALVLLLQLALIRRKGVGRTAALTGLLCGMILYALEQPAGSANYGVLLLVAPALVALIECRMERWVFSRHFPSPR